MYNLYKYNISDLSKEQYLLWYNQMDLNKQRRVDRFIFEDDKKRTVTGDALARKAIAEMCNTDERAITFDITEKGKPYAEGINVHFNISHSNDMVICAVSDKNIGVDIEKIRPVSDKMLNNKCKDKKLYISNEKKNCDTYIEFFKLWTAREAYLKLIGMGITDSKSLDFSFIDKYITTLIENGYVISIALGECL